MSHIIVESEKVISAAQAVIDRIMARREEKNEGMIARKMCERKLAFWKGYYNREEAIEALESEDRLFSHYPSIYAWGDLERAENLIVLAKNGNPVTIDTSDAVLLWG